MENYCKNFLAVKTFNQFKTLKLSIKNISTNNLNMKLCMKYRVYVLFFSVVPEQALELFCVIVVRVIVFKLFKGQC